MVQLNLLHKLVIGLSATLLIISQSAIGDAKFVQTPYQARKVLFDFYFDHPYKMEPALYWLRGLVVTLEAEPYNLSTDFMDIKVLMHGTEIVTVAKKNHAKYQTIVDRMRYYSELGVSFLVCGQAMKDYRYQAKDLYDFVEIIPSAIPELVHWQAEGYQVIHPNIQEKIFSREEIR